MILPVLMLLSAIVHAVAPGGTITGRVTGRGEADALVGVNILVQGTVRGTTTGVDGTFKLVNLPAGKYTLAFSLVGYRREIRPDVTVTDEREAVVNVSMVQAPVQTDQVVVTASKHEQSLEDVPVSVSVLDAAAISQRNSLSIDDALRYVPGVNITGTQVNIRGSSGYSLGAGSRVLLLLDGIPFIPGDTGELNFESIPMGEVERIEVVKGASSALYGSSALGGVVNVITKPIPDGVQTTVRSYGGFYSNFPASQWRWSSKTRFLDGESITHTRKVGDLGISLFLSHQMDDGYRENDYRRRYNFLMKVREDISPTNSVTLNFGLASQYAGQFLYWRNIDSALIPPTNHLSDNILSTRYYFSGIYNSAVTDHILLTTKALWYHNAWGVEESNDVARTESSADDFRLEVMSTILAGDAHTVTAGVEGDVDQIGGDIFGKRSLGGMAAYVQDEASIVDGLTATLGARFDFQTVGLAGESGQLNPKIAFAYALLPGMKIRASFGEGFRVPSLPEAFVEAGSTGLAAVPNPDLKPERSRSYEVGFAQALGTTASVDIAAFRSDIDNLIEPGLFVTGQQLQVQWRNVTRARVQGAEGSLKISLFDGGLMSSTGYTYVYPQDLTAHDILKYRPRHVLYTNARGQAGWFSAGVDFRYVSRVERIDQQLVDAGIIPDGDQRVPIFVTDLHLGADFVLTGTPLSVMLNVNNVFQHRYVELIGNIMPPRHYVLVLEAKL